MIYVYMGVSINGGNPKRWFISENPIEIDDKMGYLHFWKPRMDIAG
jgi:hypothetical protein